MGWKIIEDHLYDTQVWAFENKSMKGTHSLDYAGGQQKVRTFDDDGTLYYTAVCDDDDDVSMERFHDWSMADSGTVRSQWYDNEKQEWREFIS